MKSKLALKSSFIALFAAIISIGCFIKIPVGVVPIVLQNALCLLSGVVFGGFLGVAPVALFLLAGLVGLPIYSGGTSGIAIWLGPTGGFLAGYFLGTLVAGLIAGKASIEDKKVSTRLLLKVSLAVFIGMAVIYIPGLWHFYNWAMTTGSVADNVEAYSYTIATCLLPYLPGDIIKSLILIPIALKIRPILAQYLYSNKK